MPDKTASTSGIGRRCLQARCAVIADIVPFKASPALRRLAGTMVQLAPTIVHMPHHPSADESPQLMA
jgi:hypothetical protein